MKALIIDIPTVPVQSTALFESYSNTRNELVSEYRDREISKIADLRMPSGNTYVRGLLFLAAVLREDGHEVVYLNSDFGGDCRAEIEMHAVDSDVVLISCKTANYYASEEAAALAKAVNPCVVVLAGGPHAAARDVEIIDRGVVDVVGRGEGEAILREVMRALATGAPLRGIEGVTYRDDDGRACSGDDRAVVRDMSSIPFPAYDLMPGGIGSYHPYIDLTRGCAYKCAFCDAGTFWQNKIRHYPIEQFFQELEYVIEHSGCNLIHLVDPLFGVTKAHKEVLRELAVRDYPVYFSCDVKANYLNADLVELMLAAKVRIFCLGVESSSDETLEFIHKKATFQLELDACRLLKSYDDTYVKAYWIIGLPGETKRSLHQNVEDITSTLELGLIDEVCSHIFTPYPGTASFDNRQHYGVDVLSYDWRKYDARSYPPVYNLPDITGDEIYLTYLQVLVREIEHYQKVLGYAAPTALPKHDGLSTPVEFRRTKGGVLL
jgi:anaerobic magnesium-protoporphyrin IX monomethyl ester cyclase